MFKQNITTRQLHFNKGTEHLLNVIDFGIFISIIIFILYIYLLTDILNCASPRIELKSSIFSE